MARKNRPTLIQQFSDFINRVAPFDGNALIQKTEHNQVEDDLFDSLLNNTDSSDLINSPSAAINLDLSAFDMFRINSSGSGETDFDITINNLGTGQVARIHITKKSNDTYSFTNAVIGQIDNLKQTGTILAFFVHNINGVLVARSDMTITKTNSITDSDPEKLATAKAVNDLNALKLDVSRFKIAAGAPALITETIEIGDFNMTDGSSVSIPHGLDGTKIRVVVVTVRKDSGITSTDPGSVLDNNTSDTIVEFDTVNIDISSLINGKYDTADYNAISFNRGWITITSEQ